eukprot:13380617-Alexandrium_andersonii.AAC.1
MSASLVGSEMCIRDSRSPGRCQPTTPKEVVLGGLRQRRQRRLRNGAPRSALALAARSASRSQWKRRQRG